MDSPAISLNSTETRALELLGSGLSAEVVASALGVEPSRISQMLGREEFAQLVTEKRYQTLSKHNERDAKYDTLEDQLVDKLRGSVPLMVRPMEILKSIQVINAAKRRGQSAPSHITNQQTVVQITLPQVAVEKFITNNQNQVIKAGQQELLTIQSGSLLKEAQSKLAAARAPGDSDGHEAREAGSTGGNRNVTARESTPAAISFKQEESRSSAPITFIPVGV